MTSTMKKMTCRALVVSLLALSFQTANAGMIGADQAAAQAPRRPTAAGDERARSRGNRRATAGPGHRPRHGPRARGRDDRPGSAGAGAGHADRPGRRADAAAAGWRSS